MGLRRRRATRSGRPGKDAGLRTAEQFIAAEGNQIGAGRRLSETRPARRRPRAQVHKTAAAQVFIDRDAALAAQGGQLFERRAGGEAFDAEIARMDAQQQARAAVMASR
jgi:hypothetical protein